MGEEKEVYKGGIVGPSNSELGWMVHMLNAYRYMSMRIPKNTGFGAAVC
jgi:hypothetical protein